MIQSRRSLSQTAFAAKVDALICAAISNGATNFATLLHGLPAVYPTELLASLDRLAAGGMTNSAFAASVRQQAGASGSDIIEGRSLLPLPHPLDFEWRFTPDAARSLLNRAAEMTAADGDILLFGTPGLAVEALTLPIGRRLAFLAENNCVTDRVLELNRATGSPLSIAFCSGGLPRQSADAVLLDPPWYLDFVRPMLAAAAHACRPGGVVLISLPPDGTRPSAETDRQTVIGFGRRLGLDPIEHCPLAISYETPFFERNALAATGIYPPQHWRRGDLLVFRKTRAPTRHPLAVSAQRRDWTEARVGRMRLFVRANGETLSGEAGLTSLIDGDVLPTVSRRDARRRFAQVWTSGNRIFRTSNPQLVLEAAISCAGETMGSGVQPRLWATMQEHEQLERIAGELLALAALEAQEERGAPLAALEGSMTWRSSSTPYWNKSTVTISG
ncbi:MULTISPECIES: hypothetical protein [unclassified Mesorhizobium]|uniref:hypothetical protein n=1 Tax=unclassified Mesorhizobium TaxID=325217 RepID=UPI0011276A01|nr:MULTISPECIES: hypothetical protein [unclassified Mesorhizobium]MBZ9701768.1 hypothetical protein [Mesorhizobium sp. CO1-1-3]MBZ9949116.1 hypothetical protein [Mesorhizobium sp. BR1-1-11]TPI99676.1 hypothetical protein FJ428_22415 [Mesorhizobium sp. B2-8-1]